MTRDEALLKLLSVEPATHAELVKVTGWPIAETLTTLQRLIGAGLVTWRNGGHDASAGFRWYYAK